MIQLEHDHIVRPAFGACEAVRMHTFCRGQPDRLIAKRNLRRHGSRVMRVQDGEHMKYNPRFHCTG